MQHTVLGVGDNVVRKRPVPCPHRAQSLVGRGTGSHHYLLGLWEGLRRDAKRDPAERRKNLGRGGQNSDSGNCSNILRVLGDRVVEGKFT